MIKNMSTWSLNPFLHSTIPAEVVQTMLADPQLVWRLALVSMLLGIAYPLVHKLLSRYSKVYKSLGSVSSNKQVVILHHAVEALALTLLTPILSYYMLHLYFQNHNIHEITYYLRKVSVIMTSVVFMYMIELASRFKDPRKIIVFHHLITTLDGVLAYALATETMLKTASVLVYFICFEAFTFIGLVLYRLFPDSNVTPKAIIIGMVCFGVSRPFELLGVGAIVVGSWNDEHFVKWQGILQLVVTLIVFSLQVLTLRIHYQVWIRCVARQAECDIGKSMKTEATEETV